MSLNELTRAVLEHEDSIKARVNLAKALGRIDSQAADQVWQATIQLAIQRRDFFTALGLTRMHAPQREQAALLTLLASHFSKEATCPPLSAARASQPPSSWPDDPQQQRDLAVQIGSSIPLSPTPAQAAPVPIFGELSLMAFTVLAIEVEPIPLRPEQVLIEQGSTERAAFLLAHGNLAVTQQRASGELLDLADVQAPALLGEMYLLSEVPRRATVRAKVRSMIWRIDAAMLKRLERANPSVHKHLQQLFRRRLINNLLRVSDLLEGVPHPEELLKTFQIRTIQSGEEILSQGSPAQGIFLILHGEAVVFAKTEDGRHLQIATLSEGETFGEMSVLSGEPTTASVWMPNGGLVLQLPVGTYKTIRATIPSINDKLKEMTQLRRESLHDMLAPIPQHTSPDDGEWFLSEAELDGLESESEEPLSSDQHHSLEADLDLGGD